MNNIAINLVNNLQPLKFPKTKTGVSNVFANIGNDIFVKNSSKQEIKTQKKFNSEVKKINSYTEYEIASSKEKFSKLTSLALQSETNEEQNSDTTTKLLMNKALNSIKKAPFMINGGNLQEIEQLEQLKIRQLKKENTPKTEIIKSLTEDMGILNYKADTTVAKTHNYAYQDSPLASVYGNNISNQLAYNFDSKFNPSIAESRQDRRIREDVTNRTESLLNQGIKDMANNLAAKLIDENLSPIEKSKQQTAISQELLSQPKDKTLTNIIVDGLEPRNNH